MQPQLECGSQLAGSKTFCEAMVEIVAKVQAPISYQGGPEVWMPACLLYCSSAGAQYVKVMATHPSIVRLACGNRMDLWKGWKNLSLAASPRLGSLAGQLFEAAANVLRGQEEDEVFGAAAGGAAGGHRKARLDFANLPETLELDIGGTMVTVLAPAHRKKADLWVKLDKTMLEAVLDYISVDVEYCLQQGKRGYKRRAPDGGGDERAG